MRTFFWLVRAFIFFTLFAFAQQPAVGNDSLVFWGAMAGSHGHGGAGGLRRRCGSGCVGHAARVVASEALRLEAV